jgi:hypothetical protein
LALTRLILLKDPAISSRFTRLFVWTLLVAVGLLPGSPLAAQRQAPVPVLIADEAEYRLWLDTEQRVVNLVLPLERYDELRSRHEPGHADATFVSRLLYEHFDDAFDFILIAFDPRLPWVNDSLAALNFRVRSLADGLGITMSPLNSSYGSHGRLASVTFMSVPRLLHSGMALHELMHTWGQAVLPTDHPRHWGRSSVFGQLGGWPPGRLDRGRDGVYEPRGNRPAWRPMQGDAQGHHVRRYAELELYLMGLIPPDSVRDVEVAIGARPVPGRGAAFTAARIDTFSIGRLVAEHGERLPSWRDAQREFRGIFVILSPLPLAPQDLARWSEMARDFALAGPGRAAPAPNFWEATGGRASLQLDDLGSVALPVPRRVEEALRCAAAGADSLVALQQRALAGVPRQLAFTTGTRPDGGLLPGYNLAYGFGLVAGMGLVLVNPTAAEPMPNLLFYMPADTAGQRERTSMHHVTGAYELSGWGYTAQLPPGGEPGARACIAADEWFAQEAAWHLIDGGVLLTPGAQREPDRPQGRSDIFYWRPRIHALHLWLAEDAGVPVVSRTNPAAPDLGITLPPELFPPRNGGH